MATETAEELLKKIESLSKELAISEAKLTDLEKETAELKSVIKDTFGTDDLSELEEIMGELEEELASLEKDLKELA